MRIRRLKLSDFRRGADGEALLPLTRFAQQGLVLVPIEDAVELVEHGGPGVLFFHEEAANDDGTVACPRLAVTMNTLGTS